MDFRVRGSASLSEVVLRILSIFVYLWRQHQVFFLSVYEGFELRGRSKGVSASGDQEVDETCSKSGAHVQELIPGLPDEITLLEVATKLGIVDIDTMSFVSRGWFHAIRSRQVYEARVLANSRKWALLSNDSPDDNVHAVTLYSSLDFHPHPYLDLPSLTSPYFGGEVPPEGRSVTLDARVYVFGGLDCKVHVLDLAGHRQWKLCADMIKPKLEFGCGTIDGKIYIFGGGVSHESSTVTEIHKPGDNSWSEIRTIVSLLCSPSPIARKETPFRVSGRKFFHRAAWPRINPPPTNSDPLEFYDPIKDEWKVVEPVGTAEETMFVARGKFVSMNPLGLHIYNFHRSSWGDLRPFSFSGFAPGDPLDLVPVAILTEDLELLAVVDWPNSGKRSSCMVQSRGFGGQNKEIVWYKPEYSDKQPSRATVHFNRIQL